MFKITDNRLFSSDILSKRDFDAIAATHGVTPGLYAKQGASFVALKTVKRPTRLDTVNIDGSKSTGNVLRPGDGVATRLDRDNLDVVRLRDGAPDQYGIRADDVPRLYDPAGRGEVAGFGPVHAGKNVVEAIPFAQGVDIEAPWGGRQVTRDGYLLFSRVTGEVYGCDAAGFEAYAPMPATEDPKGPA